MQGKRKHTGTDTEQESVNQILCYARRSQPNLANACSIICPIIQTLRWLNLVTDETPECTHK
jgi:hypothetical protein